MKNKWRMLEAYVQYQYWKMMNPRREKRTMSSIWDVLFWYQFQWKTLWPLPYSDGKNETSNDVKTSSQKPPKLFFSIFVWGNVINFWLEMKLFFHNFKSSVSFVSEQCRSAYEQQFVTTERHVSEQSVCVQVQSQRTCKKPSLKLVV